MKTTLDLPQDLMQDIKILADPDNSLRVIMKDGVIYKNTL